jgi:hypothetical protein
VHKAVSCRSDNAANRQRNHAATARRMAATEWRSSKDEQAGIEG